MPERPRLVSFVLNPQSDAAVAVPYLHFGAYLQADRGGLLALSFPRRFWNMPVAFREETGVPATPVDFEWRPWLWDESWGHTYDTALVRAPSGERLGPTPRFPFALVAESGPWQLYRRVTVENTGGVGP